MRRTPLLAATALLGGLLSVLPVGPASAEEVVDRPADGVFTLDGHGWGHGRGMSQWGAQGAASLGRTADEITAAYYPGTARTVLPDAPVRVWITADEGRDTVVRAASGLTVTDAATGATQVLPDGPTRWRVTPAADGLHVAGLSGATWTPLQVGGADAVAGPVRLSGPATVRLDLPGGSSRDYRGAVTAVRTGDASLRTVDVLGLEDYLLGVVPREASAGWRPAALQAQAVAARTYSAYKRSRVAPGAAYDICDSTACQVFGGTRLVTADGRVTELEPASTTDAVRATAGVVRTQDGRPVLAEFSSSNGGWSTAGDAPYLQAREDPWDGAAANPVHSWTATLPAAALERRYPQLGTLQRLRVTSRDGNGEWGGRVGTVVLEGTSGTVTTTGGGLYAANPWPASASGLRSTWFRVRATTGSAVVSRSAAPSLVRPPGRSTGSLTVTLRNTGTTPWPADGLHLASADPAGPADPMAVGGDRPGRYTGSGDVAPGSTATFVVDLDARAVAPGRYSRSYRVSLGDGAGVGAAVGWTVVVSPALFTAARAAHPTGTTAYRSRGAAAADPAPAVLADGRTVVVPRRGRTTVHLLARNTGNVVWPGTGQVLLGTSGPRNRRSPSLDASWPSATRATRMAGTDAVAPGATAAFDVVLAGGGRPVGLSAEAFEPLWAGRHWLDGAAEQLQVVRVDPDVARLAGLDGATTTLLAPRGGGPVTLVVRLRNLGGQTWTVGRDLLAASAPERLRTSAWRSPTTPPPLARNATRPAADVVQPGEVGEWRVPLSGAGRAAGRYRTVLQAVTAAGRFGPRTATTTTVR